MIWRPKTVEERLSDIERVLNSFAGSADTHHLLHHIIQTQERIVAALDDLKAAIADLGTQAAAIEAEIDTLLTKITTPGVSEADVEAAAQSIRDLTSGLKASVDKANAAAAPAA